MNRAQIRCCCDPGRLLGTVPIPSELLKVGSIIQFRLYDDGPTSSYVDDVGRSAGQLLELPVGKWGTTRTFDDGRPPIYEMGIAIQSNDTPIDILRRISGFEEVES